MRRTLRFVLPIVLLLVASSAVVYAQEPTTLEDCKVELLSVQAKFDNLTHEHEHALEHLEECEHEHEDEDGGHSGHGHAHAYDCGDAQPPEDRDLPLHIASVFIVLVAGLLGGAIPLVSKRLPKWGVDPFVIVLGKCAATGVILTTSLIHMLLPAQSSLTSECLPEEFVESYEAYGYLYCIISALLMHMINHIAVSYVAMQHDHAAASQALESGSELGDLKGGDADKAPSLHVPHNGHVHSVISFDANAKRSVSAYFLEFGVTVHSVLIGIQLGIVSGSVLRVLLIALVFHQFFEGLALGARVADANLHRIWSEVAFILIYSVAAPIGIAVGIAVIETLNPASVTYLLVQGHLDAICAGILLYVGFELLQHDFAEDAARHCNGKPRALLRRIAMFFMLWLGMGAMAVIGRWL